MRRNSAGFSLVEVVIAMSIMAIALFGMISVITYSSRNNSVARERLLAMRAAEKKIEDLKVLTNNNALNVIFNTYSTVANRTFHVYQDSDTSLPSTVPAISPNMNSANPPPAGRIYFPVDDDNAVTPKLLETKTGAFLGRYDSAGVAMNIDMDQSGAIEATDKAGSPNLGALPVKVTIAWVGRAGPGEVSISYVFAK